MPETNAGRINRVDTSRESGIVFVKKSAQGIVPLGPVDPNRLAPVESVQNTRPENTTRQTTGPGVGRLCAFAFGVPQSLEF